MKRFWLGVIWAYLAILSAISLTSYIKGLFDGDMEIGIAFLSLIAPAIWFSWTYRLLDPATRVTITVEKEEDESD